MIQDKILIAEVKLKSPYGFNSDKSFEELFEIANKYGDWISIHTDPRWGGSFEMLRKVRQMTNKPILAKGIHKTDEDVRMAFEIGADFVLVVGRIPKDFDSRILIEPNSLEDLRKIPKEWRVVWNSRNLKTGGLKKETFEDARNIFPGWICQASNIKSIKDMKKNADAILVGEGLQDFVL